MKHALNLLIQVSVLTTEAEAIQGLTTEDTKLMYTDKNGLGHSCFFLPFEFSIPIIVTVFVYKIHLVLNGNCPDYSLHCTILRIPGLNPSLLFRLLL